MADDAHPRRVFVSCVTDDFEKSDAPFPGLRGRLRHYLARADCDVKVQEDFRQAGDVDTLEKLDAYIRDSVAVIHLIGARSGAVATQKEVADYVAAEPDFLLIQPDVRATLGDCSDLTYTQWEAYIALHHGVPLFVYVTDPGISGQRMHLERLRAAGRYAGETITDPADLLGQLIGDLHDIVPAFRKTVQRIAPPRFLHHSAENFLGRERELAMLDTAWADGTNVLTIIAWGGVGKTALLAEWIKTRFIEHDWLDAERHPALLGYFDWSFYDQGTRAVADERATRTGSVGDFFEQALMHFGDEDPTKPGKGARLAELIRKQRTLVVLDGLEPLQHPVGSPMAGRILDPDLRDLITALAQSNPGLCVVTSRQSVTDLDGLRGSAVRQEDLDDLPRAVAVQLLRDMEVKGTDSELGDAGERFGYHALSLTLLGRFLADAHDGDIRRIDRVKDLHRADELTRADRHRTAWKVLKAYEEWLARAQDDGHPRTLAVLRLTGLFDRTATAGCLAVLRTQQVIPALTDVITAMQDDEWNILLKRLERARLIKLRPSGDRLDRFDVDAHPLVREFFAEQLKRESPEAFREAHSRLYDHLRTTTPYRPDTLVDLQPLYQAVIHGCLAGRQQEACDEVYFDRILRGTEYFSRTVLGAIGADLGAVAAFFDDPWSRLSPNLSAPVHAWLLNAAAMRLGALGRLTEAVEPNRASIEMAVSHGDWKNAAIYSSNLSGLNGTLGRLMEAVHDARRAIEFADRSGDGFQRESKRSRAADALHQTGQKAEAAELFAEAERMQAERRPELPVLCAVQGFEYADLMLAPAERAAWRALFPKAAFASTTTTDSSSYGQRAVAEACAAAERRTSQTLGRATRTLLDNAIEYLTLARARLYCALVEAPFLPDVDRHIPDCETALAKFRQTNFSNELPKGLLTAAFHAGALTGDREQARCLLDEAELIAERGPMPLYLADVHLHRARLFHDRDELEKARALILKHGYGRRNEELADAIAAAVDW